MIETACNVVIAVLVMAFVEYACGRKPWVVPFKVAGSNSRYLVDWYSPSHVIHGLILYGIFHNFTAAVLAECAWEILENSPWCIKRYRQTSAVDYEGDTIINSLSDVLMMSLGFAVAWQAPWPATVALAIVLELLALWVIRDNLTLNVVMLVYPSPRIKAWQQELDVKR